MKINLSIILLVFTISVYAQSITVVPHESHVNVSNSSSVIGDLGTEIIVKNVSDNSIGIKVSREVISETTGTINYFCWESCYSNNIDATDDVVVFASQESDPSRFQVHFDNLGIAPASAVIKYCAINAADESDSACAIVNYNVNVGGFDNIESSSFSDFHPNPASSYASLNYTILPSQTAELVVTDMLGTVVENKIIQNNEGIVSLDVSNTPNGLYFANIYVDGKLDAIKRLLVRK
jgi:hypothetical protein